MRGVVKIVLKELMIFGILLVVLAFIMHGTAITSRIALALDAPSFFIHPFLWTTPFYIVITLFRLGMAFFLKKIRQIEARKIS